MKRAKYITALSAAALTLLCLGQSPAVKADADPAATQTAATDPATAADAVQASQADSNEPKSAFTEEQPWVVQLNAKGMEAIAKHAIANTAELTNVKSYTWKTMPDLTKKTDSLKATVLVTYNDGSSDEVETYLRVIQFSDQFVPAAKSGVTVKTGSKLNAKDFIANAASLKHVAAYAWQQAPSTAKAGKSTGTVLVTYADKSTDLVKVTVTVKDAVTSKKSVKKTKSKQHAVKTRTIKIYRPGKKVKTVKQQAKISRTVTTTVTTSKTYTNGKLTKTSKQSKKSYGKWSKGKWKKYKIPAVAGYKRSKTSAKAKTVTSKTKNETVKISYKQVLHKPANAPYYDPADMRAKTGNYYFKSSEKRAYPNLAKYKNLWIRVSILGNRTYIMSGNKAVYTMYSSAGQFEYSNGVYQSDTPRGTFHLKAAYGPSFMSADGVGGRYYLTYYGSDYLFHSVPINNYGSGVYYNGYHYGYGGVGSAAHLTVLGTKPDSHGCIRLSLSDAHWLYNQRLAGHLKVGTKIVIKYK